MNARVSKMLRRFCVAKGYNLKNAKRKWNMTPRYNRGQVAAGIIHLLGKDAKHDGATS